MRVIVVIFLILILGCKTVKPVIEPPDNVINYCNFIEINHSFEIKILEYIPSGCKCGVRMCASNCIGVNSNNDTIRVLSLCNSDTTFKVGQIIEVNPQLTPKYQVTIGQYWITEGNKIFLPDLQRKKINTTYGNLSLHK